MWAMASASSELAALARTTLSSPRFFQIASTCPPAAVLALWRHPRVASTSRGPPPRAALCSASSPGDPDCSRTSRPATSAPAHPHRRLWLRGRDRQDAPPLCGPPHQDSGGGSSPSPSGHLLPRACRGYVLRVRGRTRSRSRAASPLPSPSSSGSRSPRPRAHAGQSQTTGFRPAWQCCKNPLPDICYLWLSFLSQFDATDLAARRLGEV